MLTLKLQYFGHLSQRRTDWLEKTLCWERLMAGGEGEDRRWDGWMASPTQWTWVLVSSGAGDGQGSLTCCSPWGCRVGHDWATEVNWEWSKQCGYDRHMGLPESSVGKESAWNEGDLISIPGLGRSSGEGIGYPLQYSWASHVAQQVKNPSALWETWVWSPIPGLGRSPGEGKGYPLQYSVLENFLDCIVHGVSKSGTDWVTFTFTFMIGTYTNRIKLRIQK